MSAAPKIEIFQNGHLLQEIPLQGEMWVGRDEACPVHLNDRAISRKHGVFRTNEQGNVEFESRSKFGWVKINGQEQAQATLKEGDRVELGPYELRVRGLEALAKVVEAAPAEVVAEVLPVAEEMAEPQKTKIIEHEMSEPAAEINLGIEPGLPEDAVPLEVPMSAPEPQEDFSEAQQDGATRVMNSDAFVKAVLFFGPQNANVEHFELGNQEISIGRSQQCHVVLADKRSSRKHAIIRKSGNTYILRDLGSANGTMVNDARVDHEVELTSGDRIQIGDTAFTFQMVQADYEQKKEQFINVPEQEYQAPQAPLMAQQPLSAPMDFSAAPAPSSAPPIFETPLEAPKKKSLLGPLIDRYRTMSTKQQIMWGAVVLMGLWLMLEDDPQTAKPTQPSQKAKKTEVKKVENKVTFESLTPEQQRYVESQYQLGFDNYKNREYDKAIFEIEKIFSLIHDYKQAREIYSYATEGKRKLEAREEERKRKEKEAQDKLKLQAFLDQAATLMEKRKYKEAEALFPEIELLEPENNAVSAWRKVILSENERREQEEKRRQVQAEIRKTAQQDFMKAKALQAQKKYYSAIEQFEDLQDRKVEDKKFNDMLEREINATYQSIADERDPLLKKGKELEDAGNFTEAYQAYSDALRVDPESEEAPLGMKRIRGTLQGRAKSLYTEGVFAESFNDFDTAEKKYNEVMQVVPKDDDYYVKSQIRLKKITVFKKPAEGSTQ